MQSNWSIKELEKKSGYKFRSFELLKQAVTHSSFANEHKMEGLKDNERLEFLGDAVLEIVSSEFLFMHYPEMPEGGSDKVSGKYCMRTDTGIVCKRIGTWKLSEIRKRRRTDRRKKERFDCIRCNGGSDRSDLSGWWFC